MNPLDTWIEAACAELGLAASDVVSRTVLDLARDAAHNIERPAAPVTTFILGLAVGSGQPLDDAAARLSMLASRWKSAPS